MGALEALVNLEPMEKQLDIKKVKRIGGTSAGAIISTLLAVGYSIDEIKVILKELDFSKFLDGKNGQALIQLKSSLESNVIGFFSQLTNAISNAKKLKTILSELISNNGVLTGDFFRKWIEEKIKAKIGVKYATFQDLHKKIQSNSLLNGKDLFVVGTNLNLNKSEVFSYLDTPDLIISDAVRISMSIPILFRPHQYYIRSADGMSRLLKSDKIGDFYVDGGLLDNYPLWLFDNSKFIGQTSQNLNGTFFVNNQTLGFRLVSLNTKLDYENSLNVISAIEGRGENNSNDSINSIITFLMNIGNAL